MFEVLEADGVFTTTFTTVDSNGELATLTDGASPGISIKEMTSLTTAIGGDGTLFVEAYGEESAQTSYYIKDVGSVTGVHKLVVSCADLDAGSAYEVYLEDFSVDGVSVDNHKIPNIRFAVAPYGSSNVTHVNGTVVSEATDPVASITAIEAVTDKLETLIELDTGTDYKITAAAAAEIAGVVWNEADDDHTTEGTMGGQLYDKPSSATFEARTLPSADYVVVTDTIAGVTTVGSVTGAVGSVTAGVTLHADYDAAKTAAQAAACTEERLAVLTTLLTMISDAAFTADALANTPTGSVELTEEQISNLAAAVALLTKVVGQFG